MRQPHVGGYHDPGWSAIFRRPFAGRGSRDALTTVRWVFVQLCIAPLLLAFYLLLFEVDGVGDPKIALAGGIGALAAGGTFAAWRIARGGLDAESAEKATHTYRARFFYAFVSNEAPLLIAFTLCFVEGALWPYLVALPFFFVGMALIAPGRRNLDALERDLMRRGAQFSLRAELATRPIPSDG